MPPKELPDPADAPKPSKKRSKFKIIMLIGSLLLLLGAGGGAGYWWLFQRPNSTGFSGLMSVFSSSSEAPQEAPPAEGQPGATTQTQGSDGKTSTEKSVQSRALLRPVPLPEITVNLADPPGNRYLKIAMEVEVSAPDAEKELQNQTARVRDAIILLLSSKSARDLTTPEGKVLLKNEVASRLNQILGAPRIIRVFFTNFVIQ